MSAICGGNTAFTNKEPATDMPAKAACPLIESRDVLAGLERDDLYSRYAAQMVQAGQEKPAAHAAPMPAAGDHGPRDHSDVCVRFILHDPAPVSWIAQEGFELVTLVRRKEHRCIAVDES